MDIKKNLKKLLGINQRIKNYENKQGVSLKKNFCHYLNFSVI